MVPLACSSCAQVQCHARPLARSVPPSKPSSPCQHECIVIPWYVRPPVIAHATHVDFPSTPSSRNASYLSRFTCPMCFSISLCQIACMQPRGLDVISGVYVIVSTSHRAQVCGHLQIIYPMLCTDSKTHSCTLFYWVVNCKTRNYTRLSFFFLVILTNLLWYAGHSWHICFTLWLPFGFLCKDRENHTKREYSWVIWLGLVLVMRFWTQQ